jgi:hypothetical protein
MGITVAEYFAQKEACPHCAEHGNEDHCVTTLLSRKENCFFYNISHNDIGDYTPEQIQLMHKFRDILPEQETVDYYVRCDRLITKMELMDKPQYEQYSIFSGINYRYIRHVIQALEDKRNDDAKHIINSMLDNLEKENNIEKEVNEYNYH